VFFALGVKLALHYIAMNEAVNGSKGTVICTASNAGVYPFPMAPVYSATKHGVIGLVRSLARPLEREQIQINGFAPAVIGEFCSALVEPRFK
jgi:NAD(P)-dependent dehydrogenase (short-subunit alcohol dehydrogenase family)